MHYFSWQDIQWLPPRQRSLGTISMFSGGPTPPENKRDPLFHVHNYHNETVHHNHNNYGPTYKGCTTVHNYYAYNQNQPDEHASPAPNSFSMALPTQSGMLPQSSLIASLPLAFATLPVDPNNDACPPPNSFSMPKTKDRKSVV